MRCFFNGAEKYKIYATDLESTSRDVTYYTDEINTM